MHYYAGKSGTKSEESDHSLFLQNDRKSGPSGIRHFVKGDVFRIIVPLNDAFSFDHIAETAKETKEETQVKTQVKTQVTVREKILFYCAEPRKKSEIAEYCGFKGMKNFTRNYLRPLIDAGEITMTLPDKPNSQNQKYVVTHR